MNKKETLREILSLNKINGEVNFLGEGAWHEAYILEDKKDKYVIRIPKEIAYGEKVIFDENALFTEYEGQKLFYQHANHILTDIAPQFFQYYISPELTYTIESFVGEKMNLHELTIETAYNIGCQYGSFFQKLNQAKHELKGFGYLTWDEKNRTVKGMLQSDVHTFMAEENKDIIDVDFVDFQQSDFSSNGELIREKLIYCLKTRNRVQHIAFTNQDTSPENILLSNNQIHIIDPYPVLYHGHTFAGNFLNNYEALFFALHNSPRYKKHQFHQVHVPLKAISNGFFDAYSLNDHETQILVRKEQYLQLFDSLVNHIRMSGDNLPLNKKLRYGTKEQISDRIPFFIKELVNFRLD